MVSETKETVTRFVRASLHYMENASVMLSQQEAAKASELLWGSIAQALQAVAISRNVRLANHRSLRWFVSILTKELGDRTILDGFLQGERLHSNFHEVDLTVEDVALSVDPIRAAVSKLLELIPPELVSGP
ncbi:MAG: PaREP1 family protein [Chloroflexota bacterium]